MQPFWLSVMEKIQRYQTHDSLEELNKTVTGWLGAHNWKETDREVLWLLSAHSLKVLGVSWLKTQSIADELGLSYKTIQRSLKRLQEAGAIKRIPAYRLKRGGYSSWVTQILPYSPHEESTREEAQKPQPEPAPEDSEQTEAFHSNLKKGLQLGELKKHVSKQFIREAKPYITPSEILELWNKSKVLAHEYAPSVKNWVSRAVSAFRCSVIAYKQGLIEKTFKGYFIGTIRNKLAEAQRRRAVHSLPNWLEN